MKRNLFPYSLIMLLAVQSLHAQNKFIGGMAAGSNGPVQPLSIMAVCDTVFSFPTNVTWSSGLTFDGSIFYVSDYNSASIYKYDINGNMSGSIPNPGFETPRGGDLDFDGTNLWFLEEEDGTLYKMDPSTGLVLLQYKLPGYDSLGDNNHFGCAWDNGSLWVTEYTDQTLMRIDAATGALIDSFYTGGTILPLKILNGELYGINLSGATGDELVHFDKSNGSFISSIPWCLDYSLGICQVNNNVWALKSMSTNRVYEFDTLLLSIQNNILYPSGFSFCPNPVKDNMDIHFNLAKPGDVKITLFNAAGKEAALLFAERKSSGQHKLSFDLKEIPEGIYFLELNTGENTAVKKLVKMD